MSQQARDDLVNSGKLVFQDASQKSDLENTALTQTQLIALLQYLCVTKGHHIEITACRSDHHDDSDLAPTPPHLGTHAGGWAVDCWPLTDGTPGSYIDPSTQAFRDFLSDVKRAPYLLQIGLGGAADTEANRAAAGDTVFSDDGADHIHCGTQSA